MSLTFAYLSQGKLFVKQGDAVKEIQSEFGQSVQVRKLEMKRRKAWKNRGIMEMMLPPTVLQQMDQQPEATEQILITSLCQGQDGQLLYSLEAGELGGIFAWDGVRDRENRLFHNTDFHLTDLDFHLERNLLACTLSHRTGITNIALMAAEGARPREVTEGDSLDRAPRWIPGEYALVYQSAGLARTPDGYISDRAPFTIEKLDFAKQEVVSLAADPKSDLLGPQVGADGWLYYIARPYQSRKPGFHPLKALKELVLIPFRLAYAIFQWLNFFSQMYTGKPLLRAGTNQKVEPKQLRAWGDWITPELVRDRNRSEADAPPLVPKTWQLRRQALQGEPQVLAEGVLSYDLASDGTIIYTNGSGIYTLSPKGERQRLWVSPMIETVMIVEAEPE
uniref:Uncharacterized protein n=1 Tax=Cyanothece sp. (strain PCC 7425 / ATCC 29141) TaxID=395961 RepID=B8HW72_CYAP4